MDFLAGTNILIIIAGCAIIYLIAYFTYGKFISKEVFQLDDSMKTPAVEMEDGVDYVPVSKNMLMGQHFSAIAAAGPVNGPIAAALLFGWAPALAWCLIGAILIGGVHDMGALVASMRHKARSITEVIRINVTNRAWILFMLFIWITLVYIMVAFTDVTASSFVGTWALENGENVLGGGIASSSIMYLLLALAMGVLMKKFGVSEGLATLIFLPLVGLAIWFGQSIPFDLPFMVQGDLSPAMFIAKQKQIWGVIILLYCLVASVVPMWLLLQPRGALGGYFLYAALGVAAIGISFGGFTINYPAFRPASMIGLEGSPLFPILFITIACGACSGFHALVSSGTTSKQIKLYSDSKAIGYGGMLLEGMVACVSVACVMILVSDHNLIAAKAAPNFIYANGIGQFMRLIGLPIAFGISFGLMAFTTFVYDTLDICTRLGRYIIQELTGWKGMGGMLIGAGLTTAVPIYFLFQTMVNPVTGDPIAVWSTFWNTFGASNQLLASLALVGVSVWLKKGIKSQFWMVAFAPAVFMFAVSVWALCIAVYQGWILKLPTIHPAIPVVSTILIILAFLVSIETVISMQDKNTSAA
jgi:carbon starvation protein